MNRQELESALAERTFLTFAGTETYLLFVEQFPLRDFRAYEVFDDEEVWHRTVRDLVGPILDLAATRGYGLITDSLVWRASSDYVPAGELAAVNRRAVGEVRKVVETWRTTGGEAAGQCPVLMAGDLGPRGDGYRLEGGGPAAAEASYAYHLPQVRALAEAGVDLLVALTMTSADETMGIVRAAAELDLPILVSPTVETDGAIPDGSSLREFIKRVDDESGGYPFGFMVNCAHPTHLEATLRRAADAGESWLGRFHGFRANASPKSHAELDESTALDRGDPLDLGARVGRLKAAYGLRIVGGCCGTDAEHLRAIADACV